MGEEPYAKYQMILEGKLEAVGIIATNEEFTFERRIIAIQDIYAEHQEQLARKTLEGE